MSIQLHGLDGSNPMGLLAGLGVLAAGLPHWRLGWRDDGTWAAHLEGPTDEDQLIQVLQQDREAWGQDSLLTHLPDADIKMPAAAFRAHALRLMGHPSARWLGVLGNELAQDGAGKNIKPTALHFTTGQQKFLSAVRAFRQWESPDKPSRRQLQQALFQIWRRQDDTRSLSWDSSVTRDYALRLKNPSGDTKLAEAGAEWLAFRGLYALPSAPRGGRLLTACVGGGWKTGWFRWPLWGPAASLQEVMALLRQARIAALSREELLERGIFAVFVSQIRRADPGGQGSFTPARPARAQDDPLP